MAVMPGTVSTPNIGHQLADCLRQVAEGRVQVRVAEGAERDRGRSPGELRCHRDGSLLPGGRAPRRDAAGVVQRELEALDHVRVDVRADDRLGAARFRVPGVRGGQHGDQDDVRLAQHADGLDRDEFRIPGPDAHSDQAFHRAGTSAAGTERQAAANLAAACG